MLLPHSPFHEFLLLLLLLLRELSGTQPWDLIPGVISFGSEISFYTCSLDCFPHPRLSFCLHQMFHAQNWGPDFTFPDPASSPGPPCISGTFWSRCQNPSSYAPFFSVSSHTVHQPASWLCLQRIVCFHWSLAELCHVFFLLHCILLFPCPTLLPGNQLRPWPSAGHRPLITLWVKCKVPRWPLCPLWSGPCLSGGALCYHPSGCVPAVTFTQVAPCQAPLLGEGLGFPATCSRKPSLTSP